ncbi:alkaline exonuclease [Spodoptera litura nucleopolyhedrovirus II]|uniref:alkaline exonuclease n=1 Tax=Spodoptera litura nucleopolyhedrovirus II TaxID=566270 RepID=UPI00018745D9|nr:alkaline exonuclease [Spodoptera litura nucleopolyhedrovirus II]ACI47411.1 alkaline exonuclease [Spodoptera litura nucleopolyhedrovirus II]
MTKQREQQLSEKQLDFINKYLYVNYVSKLCSTTFRLSREEIASVERNTRGQSKNPAWLVLRLDRHTASGSCNNTSVPQSAAMSYGLVEEDRLKRDKFLVDQIKGVIETTLGAKVTKSVLNCGMMLSEFGLFSASPDAIFEVKLEGVDDDKVKHIPVEIKCPHTYKDKNFEQVRNVLGVRKDRYRVKHTALSVNRQGEPMFAVERTDPHYRQMQRQMYVMNAPMCVYVVKFYNSYVVLPVLRDQTFYLKEYQTELRLFERFVQRNINMLAYNSEVNRMKSLCAHYNRDVAKKLAENGVFYDFGELKCIHCDLQFDLDAPVEVILAKNKYCGDSGIGQMSEILNKKYTIHRRRVESLLDCNKRASLADEGVYCDENNRLKTFCCGIQVTDENDEIKHSVLCRYNLMLRQ